MTALICICETALKFRKMANTYIGSTTPNTGDLKHRVTLPDYKFCPWCMAELKQAASVVLDTSSMKRET